MKHLKVFENFENSEPSIDDIVEFIQPSNPMDSEEYYYYIWGDDEAYYEGGKLRIYDYLKVIEDTVFIPESRTSEKFGWDFISKNKDEILAKCKEDLISAGVRQ